MCEHIAKVANICKHLNKNITHPGKHYKATDTLQYPPKGARAEARTTLKMCQACPISPRDEISHAGKNPSL